MSEKKKTSPSTKAAVRYCLKNEIKELGSVAREKFFAMKEAEKEYEEAQAAYCEGWPILNAVTCLDLLSHHGNDKYVVLSGVIYELVEIKIFDVFPDIFNASLCTDGTVDFDVQYRDGDCGFIEALEKAIGSIKKDTEE